MKKLILFSALLPSLVFAQNVNKVSAPQIFNQGERHTIAIPAIDGLVPLKCDFHLHTTFSDGNVWPTVRVDEAWRDGLDVIAITDHLEYKPKAKYTVGDDNTSYEIAKPYADKKGVMLVKAAEITRDKAEGGHLNLLFISDANKIYDKDAELQFKQAIAQKPFVIWNHPGWAIDTCKMFEPNERWIREGKIHAIEVFNEQEYYPRASTWIRDLGLAPVAASDAHDPISMTYRTGVRRPMTLVFAAENSQKALREALFAGQSVAWFNNQLMGSTKWLEKLVRASIEVDKSNAGSYKLSNKSDITFMIKLKNRVIELPARSTINLSLPKGSDHSKPLCVEFTNLHTSENTTLNILI